MRYLAAFVTAAICLSPLAPASAVNADPAGLAKATSTRNLEDQKLRLEIRKLETETVIGYFAPVLNALTILMVLLTILSQRRTAIEIQDKAERANFDMKAAELFMSSHTAWGAKKRLELLSQIFRERMPADIVERFKDENFPGQKYYDLRLEIAKQMAAKCTSPSDVIEVFRASFPEERSIFENIYPASQSTGEPKA